MLLILVDYCARSDDFLSVRKMMLMEGMDFEMDVEVFVDFIFDDEDGIVIGTSQSPSPEVLRLPSKINW